MKRTVFYSWQSDLDPSVTRAFIEEALGQALQNIKQTEDAFIEPVLDRDASGIPGSPSISEALFAKILLSDIFLADVSIINPGSTHRKTPNPNVLIELGVAAASLGWNRILLVQNTAFGGPDILPFDLRGRRVESFKLDPGTSNRSEARVDLVGRLESVLRAAFGDSASASVYAGPDVPLWWGKWSIPDNRGSRGGDLFIREVGPAGFLFDILVVSGSHIGQLTGFARLVGADLAYARIQGDDSIGICELSFRRSLRNGRREIAVEETGDCSYFRGMGAAFDGVFVRAYDALFEAGVLDELDLARLYSITGQYYGPLSQRFQGISEQENLDPFVARATVGGVRGLYTIMEGIVMRSEGGRLWVAYIDEDVVRYFTTEREYRQRLPKTIEHWRSRFQEKKVISDSDVDVIPKPP